MIKKKLTINLFLGILLLVLFSSFILAETNACDPIIKLVSQDPNPAIPNDYVRVVFEISDLSNCNGFTVRLDQEYPFSLDSNESLIQTIDGIPYTSDNRNVWMVAYKIRVDQAAFDGDYDLKLQYHEGNSQNFLSYSESSFSLTIKDSRTQFDAVIQETSGSQVSIAIANVGKYTANSVVVRIPEQEHFTVSGTDGQMVGNLDSGDYTIVSFDLSSKMSFQQNISRTKASSQIPQQTNSTQQNNKQNFKFQVYYTDNLGERRIANMELPLALTNSSMNFNNFSRDRTNSSIFSKWYTWLIIILILFSIYYLYKNPNKREKIIIFVKSFKSKKNPVKQEIPEWVKKSKEKEKKH